MIFSVEKDDINLLLTGTSMPRNEETVQKDLPILAKRYASIKPKILYAKLPVQTVVAGGKDEWFMGDVVERKTPGLNSLKIHSSYVVRQEVSYKSQLTLPYQMAKIRKAFYTEWLPAHPEYRMHAFNDLEVYHYRQRWFRKSKKMIVTLLFLLEKS